MERMRPWRRVRNRCTCGARSAFIVTGAPEAGPITVIDGELHWPRDEERRVTITPCAEHYDDAANDLVARFDSCFGEPIRYSWPYWCRSLLWRWFHIDTWPDSQK